MFTALGSSTYPLATVALSSTPKSISLTRGANAYLRFAVAAGTSATIQWTAPPASVQFSLVRLR